MVKNVFELVVGDLEHKKQYRQYRARVKALPPGYREAAAALERYVMYIGPTTDGAALVAMLGDLADLLERSAADGLPIRDLVGEEPVDFVEAFMANYGGGSWIRSEQARLTTTISDAETVQRRAAHD